MVADDKKTRFLREVLGPDGAEALFKAVRRSPVLSQVLVPRTIISWTLSASAYGYQGPLPGLTKSFVEFRKSESPGLYSGSLTVGDDTIPFTNTTLYRLAAHVAIALGTEPGAVHADLRDLDLARLGKSIDILTKARLLKAQPAPRIISHHGQLDVIHDPVGTHPFSVRDRVTGRLIIDRLPTLADAQKIAHLQGVVREGALGKVEDVDHLDKIQLDPSLGYKFSHEHHDLGNGQAITKINVHDFAGGHVGAATFKHHGNNLVPSTVVVDDDHRRKGIASAMYAHAEKHSGKSVIPSKLQTQEGQALWAGNAKQGQFGKGELEKGWQAPSTADTEARMKLLAAIPKGPAQKGLPTTNERVKAPAIHSSSKPMTIPGMSSVETSHRQAILAATPRVQKVELPGQQAKPQKQQQPIGPTPPQKQPKIAAPSKATDDKGKGVKAAPRTPEKAPGLPSPPEVKLPKQPQMRVSKSEMGNRCRICRETQFQDGRFTGCICFTGLSKSVIARDDGDFWTLSFGESWDLEAIEVLYEAIYAA